MRHSMAAILAGLTGAIALTGCATAEWETADDSGKSYSATLTGAQEVGGGDPDGMGMAEISITGDYARVCWEVDDLHGIGPVTAMHIHHAATGQNGPVVLTLKPSENGEYEACSDGAEWTKDRIMGNPEMFYVNVHTAEFPKGAIRGQLGG